MKVAYISPIFFSDVDLSFLHELQKLADVYYFIPVGPLKKAAAISIESIYPRAGVFPASVYPELNKFGSIIDLSKTYIINRTAPHVSHPDNIRVYKQLFKFIKREKIDLVHITEFLLYTQFPLYRLRKRMVLSVHDPIPHANVTSLRSKLQRWVGCKFLKNYILFNRVQKDEFIARYHLKGKFIFDSQLSAYTYLSAYNVNKPVIDGAYLLFFGWIRKGKGLECLLPAMKVVHKKYPDLKLIVAGKGQAYFDMGPYENMNYISFVHRYIPDDELANMIANSLFVIAPYTEATQSGVIMSAFAFAKPVLATNVGGLPEMLGNDEFGRIVEAGSVDALVSGIFEMMESEQLRLEQSKRIAATYFDGEKSWAAIAEDIITHCYQLIVQKYDNE